MANASTTQASSASETTGTPIPLSYGYVWATGKRHAYYMLQDTGNNDLDYTRVGIWLLGHGEWDGPSELWLADQLTWTGDTTVVNSWMGQRWYGALDYPKQDIVFNFHSGCDATIGAGLTPSSNGPDQGVDVLYAQFPTAIQPLAFSRIAYYAIMRKQPVLYQTNNHSNDPSQWTDITPIGLWRALRCRLFDANGNVTGYAFTTNPAWHWVDVRLRRKLFPDYNLTYQGGPDPLPSAVSARFDWEPIYEAAQYFDQFLANGRRRFAGNYSFTSQTSLQAVISQILLCCRSYEQTTQGKIGLVCDKPRPSVFIFSRDHILPGSFEANDQALHTAGNRYVPHFRDILVPVAAAIASITSTNQADPTVETVAPHCFNTGDRIAIGGTGTVYDGTWSVKSVPDVINSGTPQEVDPSTFTIQRKGANYPTNVGAGGAAGLLYSRFKERSPEFWHKANMLARGAVGLNIARQRNKVKQSLDFATSTYDQVSRITRYERDRALGFDLTLYVTPARIRFKTSMFAQDVLQRLAAAIQPGDHVTVDDTVSWTYAGDYEVLDPLTIRPPSAEVSSSGDSLAVTPAQDSGEIEFTLGTYDEGYMYDTSDDDQAGWPSVPGSDPGNDTVFTAVPLANGGNFVFFSGALASGSQFQLPSTGYPASNMLAWAGPAGANINYHSIRIIQLCSADSSRLLTLIYNDLEGTTWGGDVNYAALTWLSPDRPTTSNGMNWLEFTLLGGETVLFGQGVLASGAAIVLPSGYTTDKMFAVAFPHDMPAIVRTLQSLGAYVDAGQVVHLVSSDSAGTRDYGNCAVLVFAWKNNMGTVVTENLSGANWMHCTLTNGNIFGVGCAKNMANGSTLHLPASAGDGSELEAIVGSSNGTIISGHHAQGVGTCYLDQSNVVHITFNDGSGDIWAGTADVFAVFAMSGVAATKQVVIAPADKSIAAGTVQQFSSSIAGVSNAPVIWSVDGIVGGSLSVGSIDNTGVYSAPNAAGTHTITATSVADSTITGSVKVTVWGAAVLPGSILTDARGNIIYINGEVVFVE
ncbi:MAG: hypothetical protein P4K93_07375 [Terracidiphilus sp.]|nr:hypothetical protein [Terracidiphilus sp.]